MAGGESDPFAGLEQRQVAKREDDYHQGRFRRRELSPVREDAFQQYTKKPDGKPAVGAKRKFKDIMEDQRLENEQADVLREIKKKEEELGQIDSSAMTKRQRMDDGASTTNVSSSGARDRFGEPRKPRAASKWDTPLAAQDEAVVKKRSRFDLRGKDEEEMDGYHNAGTTPQPGNFDTETRDRSPESSRIHPSRFAEIQQASEHRWSSKPLAEHENPLEKAIAAGALPTAPAWQRDYYERNRPMTDQELSRILPPTGYEIVKPPEGYVQPVPTSDTAAEEQKQEYFQMPENEQQRPYDPNTIPANDNDALPFIKPEDVNFFSALLTEVDESQLTSEEIKERRIMMLLLKVKNGTPPMRKSALRMLTEKAREFGAGPLFNQILPLLMSPTLEDQERHLLVKVIDRVLYKLDDLVRPYVHKILVVIEPLLIDEDYYARVEGREIISNLAKAAGLASMISTMRPDIDHNDEYVRNTTARAFAVIASALGIPAMLPFLKAVCHSKKTWRARHTGVKIVQQIALLVGCAVLPHLKSLVDIIQHGLKDEEQKVRTITALAVAALAEASAPYGIEAFDPVLIPLWDGISMYRGKALAAFFKAIGFIIPLMDSDNAGEFTKFVIPVLVREFQTPDDEMKKIVLIVIKQCVAAPGVSIKYIKQEIVPKFFASFWIRRNAVDKKNCKQLVETTVEIAGRVGGAEIIKKIVDELKDENESYRKIVLETIEKIVAQFGVSDIDAKLEEQLMEGLMFAFQEQVSEDTQVVLNAFGTIVNCLGVRTKPHIPQICGIVQWTLHNRSARVRQQAADLIQRIALVMKKCGEEALMGRMGVILYEYLGEEYPEVLGSILGGLKAIVNVIGMPKMTPPIKDLLPRLTPILKNRHEKVQENCIDLVGRIADRGAEYVSAREWMRICFDLLDLLKAHKKAIRRATVNTFGYIAKAIGP